MNFTRLRMFHWQSPLRQPSFWLALLGLVVLTLLHYGPPPGSTVDSSTVVRILYLAPVAAAAFALGALGGLAALALSIILMLPRAVQAPEPAIALSEVAVVGAVGLLLVGMLSVQDREKVARQRALARLRGLNAVTTIVTESLDLEQVLNSALDKTLEVLDMDAGLVFLVDRSARELTLVAYRGISPDSAAGVDRLKMGEGFCGRVALQGDLMVIPDSSTDPRLTRIAVREEGLRTQAIVPLKSKGTVQGVLAVASRERRAFSREDLDLLRALGNHIGVAIENARLHQGVEQRLRIQRRLNEVAEQITSELELDQILPKVLQIAEELTGAQAGVIALLDPESGEIHYPYLHNLPSVLSRVVVSKEKGLAGAVIHTGQSVVLQDYRAYPRAISQFVQAGVVSVAAVPLVSGARILGMLAVSSLHEPRLFTPQDVETLTGIGRQAGIAIENARLYENMRFYARQIIHAQEEERKRIAREAHDETAQILVALSRRLEALAAEEDLPQRFLDRLEGVRRLATNALQSVRRFSRDLRPPVLDDLGLVPAVEGLVAALREEGIDAQLEVDGVPRRLEAEEELCLFRIAQEALNNVRRHAQASRVALRLGFYPACIRMSIQDDGQGFEAPDSVVELARSGKLGLIGMHERARILGGTLRIDSHPGRGTTLTVEVPVHPAPG